MGKCLEIIGNGIDANKKIKIAHICTVDMTLRYLLLNQMRNQKHIGFEVYGISSPGQEVPFIEAAGIKCISVPISRGVLTPKNDLISFWRLWRIIRREKFTIVHTHTPKAGIYGRFAAKLARIPIIIHTHHGFPYGKKSTLANLFGRLEKIAAKCSDMIFSVNQEDLNFCIEKGIWPQSKAKLCGHGGIGIDLSRFNPNSVNQEDLKEKGLKSH